MDRVTVIPVGDNYMYLVDCGGRCAFVVDPGVSEPVLEVLAEKSLQLIAVLVTHHHYDHIDGIGELKKRTGCQVIASDPNRMGWADRIVAGFDVFYTGNVLVKVIDTPGHTNSSVCYLTQTKGGAAMLFTGDTLFVSGCGRLFETNAATMRKSLTKLAELDEETLVYCGHDYTVENLEFALSITPNDIQLKERLEELKFHAPTVPSTIALEKRFNPFLRTDEPEIAEAIDMAGAGHDAVFAELRRRKDKF